MNSVRRGLRVWVQDFGEFFDQAHAVDFVAGREGLRAEARLWSSFAQTQLTRSECRLHLRKKKATRIARAAMLGISIAANLKCCDHAAGLRVRAHDSLVAGRAGPACRVARAEQSAPRRGAKSRGLARLRSCHHGEADAWAARNAGGLHPGARHRAAARTAAGKVRGAAQSVVHGRVVCRNWTPDVDR